jgi:threonine dehydrogenase-like Zn-dependent dehydrogenase
VDRVPEPVSGPGQLLVAPIANGVCGSDLSAWLSIPTKPITGSGVCDHLGSEAA